MKYAIIDSAGFPTAFYSPDIHGENIPAEAVQITDEQWREFLDNQGRRKWVDGDVVGYTPPSPVPTAEDVMAERERRLERGFDYDFGDARGVHHIGTTATDMKGWGEVSTFANALATLGDTATLITAVTTTGPVQVSGLEWQQILVAAAQFRQPIWAASFVLQAMTPIPADFRTDSYWGG